MSYDFWDRLWRKDMSTKNDEIMALLRLVKVQRMDILHLVAVVLNPVPEHDPAETAMQMSHRWGGDIEVTDRPCPGD